jgi:hypothetical protein
MDGVLYHLCIPVEIVICCYMHLECVVFTHVIVCAVRCDCESN